MHGASPAGDHTPIWAQTIEDFDAGMYELTPGWGDSRKYIMAGNFWDKPQPVAESLSSDTVKSTGTNSFSLDVTSNVRDGSDPAIGRAWLNPTNQDTAVTYFMHQQSQAARTRGDAGTSNGWIKNYYDRLRFWIKLPVEFGETSYPSYQNLDIGAYVRATWAPDTEQEEGGWHYYHKLNVAQTGQWQQVILDGQVQTIRQAGPHQDVTPLGSGTVTKAAWDIQEASADPIADTAFDGNNWEAGVNYFDQLTGLYIDSGLYVEDDGANIAYPISVLIDEMEFYKEPYEECAPELVCSMTCGYNPVGNRLHAQWRSNPFDGSRFTHEAVYSFSDIHANGWASGTSIALEGSGAWASNNDYRLEATGITMGANDVVYVAIRPVGTTLFRQLSVPITQAGYDLVVNEKRDFT